MKSLIKKITVFVLALAFMVSTASVVLAGEGTHIAPEMPGWPPPDPAPWTNPGPN